MKKIAITKGKFATVDDEDFEMISSYKWQYHTLGYTATSIGGRKNSQSLLMHRLIMDAPKGKVVDHINGDKLDNRKSNLRVTDQSLNLANSKIRSDNTTGYKGVTFSKLNRNWMARIYHKGKHIHLGSFDDINDAARMYNFWASDLYGDFARLNVIEEETA